MLAGAMIHSCRQLSARFVKIKFAGIATTCWTLDICPPSITKSINSIILFTKNQDMQVLVMFQFSFIIVFYLIDIAQRMSVVLRFGTIVYGMHWVSSLVAEVTMIK